MYTFTQRLIQAVPHTRIVLFGHPEITPDLTKAGIDTIIVVIFCAMLEGRVHANSIYGYLKQQGCQYDRDTVDFILNRYDGPDVNKHLWTRNSFGDYMPLIEAIPPEFRVSLSNPPQNIFIGRCFGA